MMKLESLGKPAQMVGSLLGTVLLDNLSLFQAGDEDCWIRLSSTEQQLINLMGLLEGFDRREVVWWKFHNLEDHKKKVILEAMSHYLGVPLDTVTPA